jgi:hypothetical protein
MAATPKKLFRGAATVTTTTVLYTVPASTTTVVSNIVVTNTAASAGTFTLGMGTAGSNTSFATTVAIAANSIVTFDIKQVLNATETFTGGASATTINFQISGVEIA